MPNLDNIKVCVFDAYGTLFDVHSAVERLGDRIVAKSDQLSGLWRSKQLEYTWLRSLMGAYVDFWQVTGDALDYAMDVCELEDINLRTDLMNAYLELDPYPEVMPTLAALKQRGLKTAILSNGSPKMLRAAVEGAGLGDDFDNIFSVEEIGVYKPDPRVYRLACDRLDLEADKIVFISANAWDAGGAANFGLRTVWLNRLGSKPERLPRSVDVELPSLAGLPDLLV